MPNPLNKLSNWYFQRSALPYWGILLLDCLIVVVSSYLTTLLQFGPDRFVLLIKPITLAVICSAIIFLVCFRIFHTYFGVIRYSSFEDLRRITEANSVAAITVYLIGVLLNHLAPSIIVQDLLGCIIQYFAITLLMWLSRVIVKTLYDNFRTCATTKKALIYGVKAGGVAVAKSMKSAEHPTYTLAGFVAPEGDYETEYLMGVKVYKDTPALLDIVKEEDIAAIVVSPLQVDKFREQENLINDFTQLHIKILMMPKPEEWDGKSDLHKVRFKEVEIEDLLPRQQIEVDMNAIAQQLQGKRILITGAAGSIGSEIVRQVAQLGPSELVLIDQAETPMHDVRLWSQQFLNGQQPTANSQQPKIQTIVASITNQPFMERIFADHKPEYVFHAAAYKHVPMMEDNPSMAVQNNIYGTRVIADLAVKYGTKKFVMISTDKAVNPTNVMGCSKRICEIYCQSLNQALQNAHSLNSSNSFSLNTTPEAPENTQVIQDIQWLNNLKQIDGSLGVTQFVTTRFGNVLGSNGSVIPLFREQIKNGGPLTVTHPDIIRFFMLIPEACKLVLEAGTMGKGGEIFVFDMGKPVKIVDLAKRMIALSGAEDIEIKFTGLRDGEKLYEEVLSDKENTKPTQNKKIMVAQVREYDYETASENEKQLLEASYTKSNKEIVKMMMDIVPEYKSTNEEYTD